MSIKVLVVLSLIAAAACSPAPTFPIGHGGGLGGGLGFRVGGGVGGGVQQNGGTGLIGGLVKGIFGTINGVANLAFGALEAVLKITIGALNDVFTLIVNLSLVLQVTLNNLVGGLGSLFIRLVACIIKIAVCVLGFPGDRGVCAKGWNVQFGINGEASTAADLIILFRLNNAQAELNGYINTITKGRGISSTNGSVRTILDKITTLVSYTTNYQQISKKTVTDTFVIMTTVSGCISNSRQKNSGVQIIQKIVPECGKYFKQQGYPDITVQITTITNECSSSNGDNINWNGNTGSNTGGSTGGSTAGNNGGSSGVSVQNGGTGLIGGLFKGIFGTINGVANLAFGALDAVLKITIGALNDVFSLIVNLSLVLQVTLNNLVGGLGSLFIRLVACIIKIAVCVLGFPGDRGVCARGWNVQFGINGEASTAADLIILFRLNNAQAELNGYINTITKGRGISSTNGSIRTILEKITTLVSYTTNYQQISKKTVTDTFVIMTTVSGCISNSRQKNSGVQIIQKIVPECGKYFKQQGYPDITDQVTTITNECNSSNGDNINWNGNGNSNTGSDNSNTNTGSNKETTDNNTSSDKGNTDNNTSSDKGNTDNNTSSDTGNTDNNNSSDKGNTDNNTSSDKGNTDNNTSSDKGNTDNNTSSDTGNTDNNTSSDKGNTDNNTSSDKGNTDNNTSSDKGNTDNNTSSDKGNTDSNTSSDKGNTDNNTSSDKGNTDNNTSSDKGNTDNNTSIDKGNTDNNTSIDKGNTDNNTSSDKGNTDNNTSSDKGNTDNNTSSDKGNTDNNTSSDKGNTDNNTSSDKGNTDNNTSSDKGNTDSNTSSDKGTTDSNTSSDKGNTDSNTSSDKGTTDSNTSSDKGNTDSNTGGDTGNGVDLSVSIGGIIKLIPGATSISSNIINEIIKININTFVDIVNLVTKLAVALGGIIDSIISGLGSILIRIVAVIFKIECCVNGLGSDKSICTKEWNAQFGITGEATTAVDLIALFRLTNCKNDVATIVSKYTNGKGISSTSGFINIILQKITDLSVTVSSGTISKENCSTVFVNVISIFGSVTNSYQQGSGTVLIQKLIPICAPVLIKQGLPDIRTQQKTLVSTVNVGNNDKFNWKVVKNGGDSSSDKLTKNVKKVFKDVKANNNGPSLTAVLNLQAPRNFDDVCSFGVQVVQALGGILDVFINGLGSLIARIVGCLINYIVAVLGATRNAKSFVSQKAYYTSFGVTVSGSTWADLAAGFKINNAKADLDGVLNAYTHNKGLKSLSGAKLVFFNSAYSLVDIVSKGTGIVEGDLTSVFRVVTTIIGGFANSCSANVGKTICDNMLPTVSFYLEKNGYPSLGSQSNTIYSTIETCNNSDAPWASGTTTTVVRN